MYTGGQMTISNNDPCDDWSKHQVPKPKEKKKTMTEARKLRLLKLATTPHDHKRWYSQYCQLINEGLVGWQLGHAYLTTEGKEYLENNP